MTYDYSFSNITIQQIQIFLSAAETRNFTRSANELNMTQPGISKSISTLENVLGFSLFKRTSRKVELTEAGLILYQKWAPLLPELQDGYHEARHMYDEMSMTLNIGVTNTTDTNKYFWPVVNQFYKEYPDMKLNIESEDMLSLENNLSNGTYDLIFIPDFEHYSLDKTKTPWKYAAKSNIQIIVQNKNPLCQKKELTIADILGKEVIILDPEYNPNFLISLQELYHTYGDSPKIGGVYKSNFQLRYAQMTQDCIHITDDFWAFSEDDFSKKIPLKDHFNGIICAWNPNNSKSCLDLFLNIIPKFD